MSACLRGLSLGDQIDLGGVELTSAKREIVLAPIEVQVIASSGQAEIKKKGTRGWRSVRREGEAVDDGDALRVKTGRTVLGLAGSGSSLSVEAGAAQPARRLRRFYVSPRFRRQGVATALASALIHEGLDNVGLLTVNAAASPVAGPFWEAQGFVADTSGPWTHILRGSILVE